MRSQFIRSWVPKELRDAANRMLGATITYGGPYPDWDSAQRATAGYGDDAILRRVHEATRKSLDGEANYEQDGSAMSGVPPPSHALAALLLTAALDGGRLSVLDFGGGLGSHFLRWRQLLAPLPELRWTVVEQAHFAAAGRRLFAGTPTVAFVEDIGAAAEERPNAVLMSSVLQYLPDPLATLDRLIALSARMFVIDRTPLLATGNESICSQHVPRQLGRASYPIRLLPKHVVEERLQAGYTAFSEFESDDAPVRAKGIVARYSGSVWMRKR